MSGLNQFPAKEPYLYTGTEGSNPSLSAKLAFIEPHQPRQTLLNPVAVKASRNAMWNMDARFGFFADIHCI